MTELRLDVLARAAQQLRPTVMRGQITGAVGALLEAEVPGASIGGLCELVDGTLWRDDEMAFAGVGDKLGSEMGHLQQSGPGGMIELLDAQPASRKVLIHINNTNPILDEDSAERAELVAHGIEVAHDGMQIVL